ncbi:unnamed protein product [marine sediment metagenome]|uniref:Uncharacterized protein n=1 Tax=marine sediment metagenome TaxID=412755 RepID=X1UZ58_9ZZZZ
MKIKVGDKVYDGKDEPVMVILKQKEKKLIADMSPKSTKYCMYPDKEYWTKDDCRNIKAWIEDA